jgi:predicted nucleic acid-binding protein
MTSTMSKIFLDTNVLVHATDHGQPAKQSRAIELLRSFGTGQVRGVISTQVMQEFYVVATRKLGVEPLMAKGLLHDFSRFELIQVHYSHINDAIDCSVLNQVSFWDALIIVSAESGQCERLWTEDLNHGQVIRGVRMENPFRED